MGEFKGKNELSNDNMFANTSVSGIDRSHEKSNEHVFSRVGGECEQLRRKLRACRKKLRQKLAQEFPVPQFNIVDKQCFAFLHEISQSQFGVAAD